MNKALKQIAIIFQIVTLLSIAMQLLVFFQTEYLLLGPIIPQSDIIHIVHPFIVNAMITVLFVVGALIFYYFSKYIVTIILCVIPLVWQQVFQHFIH